MTKDESLTAFWAIETHEIWKRLDSSPEGITQAEAARRLTQSRRLTGHRRSSVRLLLDQFKSPIIVLLFCAAVLTFSLAYYDATTSGVAFAISDAPDGCIIVIILLASGLLGFWQELSAADAVAQLLRLIETQATVLRDGAEVEVPLQQVVVGDVICLSAGEVIPGDCRLIESHELFLNEAALTGESFPAEKHASVLALETPLAQRANAVHLGTHVMSGYGRAVVVLTGGDTELGKISARLEHKAPETSFERGIRHFGHLLIKIVVVITVIVFAIKVGWQDKPLIDSLLVGLALAVGMTPQLLPAVTSVVLSAGAKAMARQQVIVKQLLAIENLGSMTVLCSDKTGTLTEGSIQLHGALAPDGTEDEIVFRLAYLNATLQSGFANPIDRSLREAGSVLTARSSESRGHRRVVDLPHDSEIRKVDEVPYDFVRKRLTIRIAYGNEQLLIMKGALTQVLTCCTRLAVSSDEPVELAPQLPEVQERFQRLSDDGWRVLGLAIKSCDAEVLSHADESDMTFVGFLVFADPPKADAKETIQQLRELGVGLKIITGDNRAVAEAISRRVGVDSPKVLTGSELRLLHDSALRQRAQEADIFAEVEPNQKEQIILALKRAGHVVGYLGDGINDASALHAADVGISVSEAVDVAKEAAQVVLLKQDLGVLVRGVREGRRTFSNTLKYVFFAIAANFGYMLSLAISGLFLPFEPLLASQILLVNLLADFPAMALAADSVDPEQIARPRRWDTKFILRFMLSFGLASSCFDFMTFGAIYWLFSGLSDSSEASHFEKLFQTGWFVESTLTGLVILLAIRTRRLLWRSRPGCWFWFAEVGVAVVTIALPYSPAGDWMGFVAPPIGLLLVVLAITALYGVGMELVKAAFYRRWD